MASVRIELFNRFARPVFSYSDIDSESNVFVLYDSGAEIPVWCGAFEALRASFKDAYLTDKKTIISGFGGNGNEIPDRVANDIAIIPELRFTDGNNAFCIYNLYVAIVEDTGINTNLILSASLFNKTNLHFMKYGQDGRNVNYMQIDFHDDVTCYPREAGSILTGVYVLAQNEI